MKEKFSSLHDDVFVPHQDKDRPEYEEKNFPERHQNVGKKGENSVIQRIKQFGISQEELKKMGIENPRELTEKQYSELLRQVIKEQYDTLFPSVFTHWSELKNQEQLDFIKKISQKYKNWGFNLIKKGGEPSQEEPNLLISLEGGDAIKSLSDLKEIHKNGVNCITLQYGGKNALADKEGLTSLGRQVIKKMFDLGIIVDLAHALPKTRKDIFELAATEEKGFLLAYTHGATAEDIDKDSHFHKLAEKRGLQKKEVEEIVRQGGIIGLGVTRPFFQSIEQIAERIDRIAQLKNGPESLGIGSDLGGVPQTLGIGINNIQDFAKIGDVLSRKFGYEETAVKNILRNNIRNWVTKK